MRCFLLDGKSTQGFCETVSQLWNAASERMQVQRKVGAPKPRKLAATRHEVIKGGTLGEIWWVILHSKESAKVPRKLCPIFRPDFHPIHNNLSPPFLGSAKTDPVRFKWGFGEGLLKDKFAFFEASKRPILKRRKLLAKRPFFQAKKAPLKNPL